MTNFEKNRQFFKDKISLNCHCCDCPVSSYCEKYGTKSCIENFVEWAVIEVEDYEEEVND